MPFKYNPDKDIPDLSGKVFLVTGGTAGVGKETIIQLSKHAPKHIYFTGRNTSSATALITFLSPAFKHLTFIPCDQTSLVSVSSAIKSFLEKSNNQLDVLICNAGVMAIPLGLSKDGYEMQFAVNHLTHALIVKLCLGALGRSEDGRIVVLTSLGFKSPPKGGIRFGELRSEMGNLGFAAKFLCYGQSKLANVLYAQHLATLYPDITSVAVHPGLVTGTSLADHMNILDKLIIKGATLNLKNISVAEGAYNTLWAATSIGENGLKNGGVYEPVGKPVEASRDSGNKTLEKELWDWTEKEIAAYM